MFQRTLFAALWLAVCARSASAGTLAHSSFEEPGVAGATPILDQGQNGHLLASGAGQMPTQYGAGAPPATELGYTAVWNQTRSNPVGPSVDAVETDFIGVSDWHPGEAFPDGEFGYYFEDTDGLITLTFDAAALSGPAPSVRLDVFVAATTWEVSDRLSITVEGDGGTIALLDTTNQDMDAVAAVTEGQWRSYSAPLAGWTSATLKIEADTNSGDEWIGIDNLRFTNGDCNDNGALDATDVTQGTSADCNANAVPDECDLAGPTSADCNEDGVPDECNPQTVCPTLLQREKALDVRIVTYNVHLNFISDPSRDAGFARVMTALDPDVMLLVEVTSNVSAEQLRQRMDSILPLPSSSWAVHLGLSDGRRTVIVSRHPLSLTREDTDPPSSNRGVNCALVDLPDDLYSTDIYLMGVHLKCCNDNPPLEDSLRQKSADAIAAWMGDARQPGGRIDLPLDTPMIVLGDFNLVGGPQPALTLVTGDIIDNATYGSDVPGDWDGTVLTDLAPADLLTEDTGTWHSDTTNPGSRLDRFIYTDSVVPAAKRFVLNTLTLSAEDLADAGLQGDDTASWQTSDHLPIAMDLRLGQLIADCNGNDVADAQDLASGDSLDCDADAVPDECAFPGCGGLQMGDLNCDARTDGRDVQIFVRFLLAGRYACQADADQSGQLDDQDIAGFVARLMEMP